MFPTPKDSVRHRQAAADAGGQLQFPLLVDSNTQPRTVMYESSSIVEYLYRQYGGAAEPPTVRIRSQRAREIARTLGVMKMCAVMNKSSASVEPLYRQYAGGAEPPKVCAGRIPNTRSRSEILQRGKMGTVVYDSSAIVGHLYRQYGIRAEPPKTSIRVAAGGGVRV